MAKRAPKTSYKTMRRRLPTSQVRGGSFTPSKDKMSTMSATRPTARAAVRPKPGYSATRPVRPKPGYSATTYRQRAGKGTTTYRQRAATPATTYRERAGKKTTTYRRRRTTR